MATVKFNPMAALVAAGATASLPLADYTPLFAEFTEAAKLADDRKANLGTAKAGTGSAGAVWPKVRAIMLKVQADKISPLNWQTMLTHFDLSMGLAKSSTAKSYLSTLKNGPYVAATPEAVKANKDKPVDLANVGYGDLRSIMKGAADIAFAAHDPIAVQYQTKLAKLIEALRDVVKDKRAVKETDKSKAEPALIGISYKEGVELLEVLASLIPARAEKVEAEPVSETPITDAAEGTETVEAVTETKAA